MVASNAKPHKRRQKPSTVTEGVAAGDETPAVPSAVGDSTEPGPQKSGRKRSKREPQDVDDIFPDDGAAEENPSLLLTDLADPVADSPGMLLTDLVQGSADVENMEVANRQRKLVRKKKATKREESVEDVKEQSSSDEECTAAGPSLVATLKRIEEKHQSASAPQTQQHNQAVPESEFLGGSLDESVTVEDLLAPISHDASFSDVRKQLEGLTATELVAEPASEAKRGREQRKAEYGKTSDEGKKWEPQVKFMKDAEQVVLGEAPDTEIKTINSLSETVPAADDFEAEFDRVVGAAGASEEDLTKVKALPQTPVERDEAQRQQVQRLKYMMFKEHQHAKRVKKIKSKTYHRIQRRAERRDREALLERLDVENPELADALRGEYEKKFAEKRLLRQRHARKKWTQTMQRFAKGERSAQQEISRQAQEAHDEERGLRRAIKGKANDSDSEDAPDLSGGEDDGGGEARRTLEQAKKLTLQEIRSLEKAEGDLPTTGIMGMPFMRQALQKRREAARLEAKGVLTELEGLTRRLDKVGEEEEPEAEEGPSAEQAEKVRKEKKFTPDDLAKARQEVESMWEEDGVMTAETSSFDASVAGPLTVQGTPAQASSSASARKILGIPGKATEEASSEKKPKRKARAVSSTANAAAADAAADAAAAEPAAAEPAAAAAEAAAADDDMANPWLSDQSIFTPAAAQEDQPAESAGASASSTKGRKKRRKVSAKESLTSMDTGEDVLNVLNADSKQAQEQRDLVRTAFVEGLQEEEYLEEQEEAAEKKAGTEKEVSDSLPGWGSWAGEGAPQPKRKPAKLPRAAPKPTASESNHPWNVVINEKLDTKANKYFANYLDHGSKPSLHNGHMKMPLGPEWTGMTAHLAQVKPKTFLKVGGIVPPLAHVKDLPEEQRDAALKTWCSKRPMRQKARM